MHRKSASSFLFAHHETHYRKLRYPQNEYLPVTRIAYLSRCVWGPAVTTATTTADARGRVRIHNSVLPGAPVTATKKTSRCEHHEALHVPTPATLPPHTAGGIATVAVMATALVAPEAAEEIRTYPTPCEWRRTRVITCTTPLSSSACPRMVDMARDVPRSRIRRGSADKRLGTCRRGIRGVRSIRSPRPGMSLINGGLMRGRRIHPDWLKLDISRSPCT